MDPMDPAQAEAAMLEGFHAGDGSDDGTVTCPACGHRFTPGPAVRVTEAATTEAISGERSAQDTRALLSKAVEDRISTATGKTWAYAYVLDHTAAEVVYEHDGKQWQCSYTLTEEGTAGTVTLGEPAEVLAQTWYVPAAGGSPVMAAAEAADPKKPYGDVTYADPGYQQDSKKRYPLDTEDHVRAAWSYINQAKNAAKYSADDLKRVKARIKAAMKRLGVAVSESGDTTEEQDRIDGRVLEAKGEAKDGGRVFRVRIIAAGDSKNGRRYPAAVLREAVQLYEGAKAYDHHRTMEELRSSTISGLVGYYRNVEASTDGLDGDLCLLPSATHTAEALDATLAAQDEGLPPLVGISHDAMTVLKPIVSAGRRLQEAVAITKVNSADVVADPSAGGKATRVLAGGSETDPAGDAPDGQSTKESDVPVTPADVLAALQTATTEQLAAVGLSKATTESTAPETPAVPVVQTTEAAEPQGLEKTSFLAKLMVQQKVADAGLPTAVVESLTEALPDRVVESDVDARIASLKTVLGVAERAGLAPAQTAQVSQEAFDKKRAALDAFFAGDFNAGYRSFRSAWADITGYRSGGLDLADVNRRIMRESIGNGEYNSVDRSTESLVSSSWDAILGDSITRRMVAAYAHPSLQDWRQVSSSIVPVNDFRTQRIDRLGGYGTLPTVNQGQPYQPLTSPGDEEVTYALTKKGGTEDLTLEMIANDDIRAIGNIPGRLGLAAARTLHDFVWAFFSGNPTIYDSVALFHSNHANTTAVALGQSGVSQLRALMRSQTAYGDTSDILSIVPRFLIVPNELEELAFQLTTSAVAIPSTPAGAADTPNLHQGTTSIVVDYFTDANDWFLVCDPSMCPTIEVGFYQGRQEPELFTQADQTVGSMFNSDKLTYKIRHIYSGAVLEYRGFQRGTQ